MNSSCEYVSSCVERGTTVHYSYNDDEHNVLTMRDEEDYENCVL